ncbi:putative G-protein coupled receptor 139 isoform X2 [Tubulanus polymorphus]
MTTPITASVTSQPSIKNYTEYQIGRFIYRIFPVIGIIVATIGNTMCLILMNRKSLRESSASVYLSAIAVADTCTVYTGLLPAWLQAQFDINLAKRSTFICHLMEFLLYSVSEVAVWLVVALTIDRFISVVFPLKARYFCTKKKASVAIAIICALATIKNVHIFFTRGPVLDNAHRCQFLEPFEYFEAFVRPWIAFTLYAFLPISIIFACNIAIVYTLIKIRKKKLVNQASKKTDRNKRVNSMTGMFLAISLTFLCLITPSISVVISIPYWGTGMHDRARLYLTLAVTEILVYSNHSVNFVLYCITGRRFREEFLKLCSCCPSRSRVSPVDGTNPGGELSNSRTADRY